MYVALCILKTALKAVFSRADPAGFEPVIFSVTRRRVRPGYTTGPVPGVGFEPTNLRLMKAPLHH